MRESAVELVDCAAAREIDWLISLTAVEGVMAGCAPGAIAGGGAAPQPAMKTRAMTASRTIHHFSVFTAVLLSSRAQRIAPPIRVVPVFFKTANARGSVRSILKRTGAGRYGSGRGRRPAGAPAFDRLHPELDADLAAQKLEQDFHPPLAVGRRLNNADQAVERSAGDFHLLAAREFRARADHTAFVGLLPKKTHHLVADRNRLCAETHDALHARSPHDQVRFRRDVNAHEQIIRKQRKDPALARARGHAQSREKTFHALEPEMKLRLLFSMRIAVNSKPLARMEIVHRASGLIKSASEVPISSGELSTPELRQSPSRAKFSRVQMSCNPRQNFRQSV